MKDSKTVSGTGVQIDSSDMEFKIDRDKLAPKLFIKDDPANPNPTAYIQVYKGKDEYLGQIGLPIMPYSLPAGFHSLTDSETNCAAVLFVKSPSPTICSSSQSILQE